MTLSIKNVNEDGSIILTDGVSELTAHDYDLNTIVPALAHADAKHMAWALVGAVRSGRAAFHELWVRLTAAKLAMEGKTPELALGSPGVDEAVALAHQELTPPAPAEGQEAAPAPAGGLVSGPVTEPGPGA